MESLWRRILFFTIWLCNNGAVITQNIPAVVSYSPQVGGSTAPSNLVLKSALTSGGANVICPDYTSLIQTCLPESQRVVFQDGVGAPVSLTTVTPQIIISSTSPSAVPRVPTSPQGSVFNPICPVVTSKPIITQTPTVTAQPSFPEASTVICPSYVVGNQIVTPQQPQISYEKIQSPPVLTGVYLTSPNTQQCLPPPTSAPVTVIPVSQPTPQISYDNVQSPPVLTGVYLTSPNIQQCLPQPTAAPMTVIPTSSPTPQISYDNFFQSSPALSGVYLTSPNIQQCLPQPTPAPVTVIPYSQPTSINVGNYPSVTVLPEVCPVISPCQAPLNYPAQTTISYPTFSTPGTSTLVPTVTQPIIQDTSFITGAPEINLSSSGYQVTVLPSAFPIQTISESVAAPSTYSYPQVQYDLGTYEQLPVSVQINPPELPPPLPLPIPSVTPAPIIVVKSGSSLKKLLSPLLLNLITSSRRQRGENCWSSCDNANNIYIPYPIPVPTNNPIILYDDSSESYDGDDRNSKD